MYLGSNTKSAPGMIPGCFVCSITRLHSAPPTSAVAGMNDCYVPESSSDARAHSRPSAYWSTYASKERAVRRSGCTRKIARMSLRCLSDPPSRRYCSLRSTTYSGGAIQTGSPATLSDRLLASAHACRRVGAGRVDVGL